MNSYRSIDAGDRAVMRNGARVVIGDVQIQTSEGASYGIIAIRTAGGSVITPRDIQRYEKPDGRPIPY